MRRIFARQPRMHPLVKLLAVSLLAAAWILILVHTAHAGGPLYVAGVSYFDPAVKGVPLTWAQGTVAYYTDQGDLSPLLPQASANALVADAFSRWANVQTVALAATQAGSLAEDVNGTNVTITGGALNLPTDIQPSAVGTPVGIVYDLDGQVTETLLGTGSSADCVNNAVYGGLDAFTTGGNFAHALVILNGLCAQDPALLSDFEYRLVRVLGRVLGLAPSQANLNVWTGNPPPTAADQAGFPAKHAMDPSFCLPIAKCLTGADQPKMDDRAALGRLYPVTPLNQVNFPGKSVFAQTTARIHGVVRFPDSNGVSGQGMQGVNIVARWIDPVSLQPSRTYVATAVSGFLYRGNAGNPVTGFADPAGNPYNQWGSDDSMLQGFFDLAGLEFPDGSLNTSYELTIERVDPLLSFAVGPYAPLQVQPSGAWIPLVVSVSAGGDLAQDLVMGGGATPVSATDSQDYLNPLPVTGAGEWRSYFDAAGGTNYYGISAQTNRTFSVEVQTLDEKAQATEGKAQPVIGVWAMTDPPGTPPPAATPSPFNAAYFAETRLDAQVLQSISYRIGITDWRGDGRPDYAHLVRVLYGDAVNPPRATAAGTDAVQIQGFGFRPSMIATVGGLATPYTYVSGNQVWLLPPALPDGAQTVLMTDPSTGGFTTLTNALTTGAAATDTIQLLPVPNPAIPVGGTTPNALQFEVVAADGITTVAGATVSLSATNGLTLQACGGLSSCSVFSDASGRVITDGTVTAVGVAQVTAQLAPGSYPNPSTVVTTLVGTASSLDIALTPQFIEVEQGTTLALPLVASVLNNGIGLPGRRVNFQVAVGQGMLNALSVMTDANGKAANGLQLTQVAADVQVTACVSPGNAPCKTFSIGAVPVASLRIEAVSGVRQVTLQGQLAQVVVVRVTDGASPPNPIFGANVLFHNQLSRTVSRRQPIVVDGEIIDPPIDLVILGATQTRLLSDIGGLSQLAAWASPVSAGEEVAGSAVIDTGAAVAFSWQVLDPLPVGGVPRVEERGRGRVFLSQGHSVKGDSLGEFVYWGAAPVVDSGSEGGTEPLAGVPEGADAEWEAAPEDADSASAAESPAKKGAAPAASIIKNKVEDGCDLCGGKACSVGRSIK